MNFDELIKKYNLLQDEEGNYYRLDKNGKKQELYAPVRVLAKILGISTKTIKQRIKFLNPVKTKDRGYRVVNTYSMSETMKACADFLDNLPVADKSGIVVINNKKYAPINVLTKMLGISNNAIKQRIKTLQPVTIKAGNFQLVNAYELTEAKKLCADLLQDVPVADKSGIVVINNKKYAPISVLAKILGISEPSIKQRVKSLQPIKTKDRGYRVVNAYSIAETKKVCNDLLDNLPVADKSGIVVINNNNYASINSLAKILGISRDSIKPRVKSLQPVKIKSKTGQAVNAYSIFETEKACADLLAKKKQQN